MLIPFLVEKLMNSFASSKKTCNFVYILNKHGIITYDVNVYHRNGSSLLIEAIFKRNYDLYILLAKHPRININFQDQCNDTALSLAAQANLNDLVELLINHENFDPIKSRIINIHH